MLGRSAHGGADIFGRIVIGLLFTAIGIALLLAGMAFPWWSDPEPDETQQAGQEGALCDLIGQYLEADSLAEAIVVLELVEEPEACMDPETARIHGAITGTIALRLAQAGLCDEANELDPAVASRECKVSLFDLIVGGLAVVAAFGAALVAVQLLGQSKLAVRLATHPVMGRAALASLTVTSAYVALTLADTFPLGDGRARLIAVATAISLTSLIDFVRSLGKGDVRPRLSAWFLGIGGVIAVYVLAAEALSHRPSLSDWPLWLTTLTVGLLSWYGLTIALHGFEPRVSLVPPPHDDGESEEAALLGALKQMATSEPDGLDAVSTPDDPDELDVFIDLTGKETSGTLKAVASLFSSYRRKTDYRASWDRPMAGDSSTTFVTLSRGSSLIDSYHFDLTDYEVPPSTEEDSEWDADRRRGMLFAVVAVWLLASIQDDFFGRSTIFGTTSWESAVFTVAASFWTDINPGNAEILYSEAVQLAREASP